MKNLLPLALFAAALFCFAFPSIGAKEAAIQPVQIAINTPATNYSIKIVEIRQVGEELWVLSQVFSGGGIGGAAITKASDRVEIPATGLPVKHFVLGKTWGWEDPKTVTYLPKEGMTDEKWKAGKVVFERKLDEEPLDQ